jgi:hypothetical protein
MRSLLIFAILAVSCFCIDITQNQRLAFQSQELCIKHSGVFSSAINTQMSGSVLKINPYNWNDGRNMTCKPTTYSADFVNNDIFAVILGERLMPMVKNNKNIIVFYNCTYDDDNSWEPVFLVNAKDTIMLDFPESDCQITFGYSSYFNFGNLSIEAQSQNPNQCSKVELSGKISLTQFVESGETGRGTVQLYTDILAGTSLLAEGKDIAIECSFDGTGVYSTIVCPDDQIFEERYGLFQFFYLADGVTYYYYVDGVSDSCWQYAFAGLGLKAFGMLWLFAFYWLMN